MDGYFLSGQALKVAIVSIVGKVDTNCAQSTRHPFFILATHIGANFVTRSERSCSRPPAVQGHCWNVQRNIKYVKT